jgi:hypothetical protein
MGAAYSGLKAGVCAASFWIKRTLVLELGLLASTIKFHFAKLHPDAGKKIIKLPFEGPQNRLGLHSTTRKRDGRSP